MRHGHSLYQRAVRPRPRPELDDKIDLWLIEASEELAEDRRLSDALLKVAKHPHSVETLSMIGVIARTVVPIRETDGTGEIVFTHAGTRRVAGARSDCGRAIAKGTEVIVTSSEQRGYVDSSSSQVATYAIPRSYC